MRLHYLFAFLMVFSVSLVWAQNDGAATADPATADPATEQPAVEEPVTPAIPDIDVSKLESLKLPKAKDTVATVNGEKITGKELLEAAFDWQAVPTLDFMIILKLIDQDAKKNNVEVTDDEVNTKMKEMLGGILGSIPPGTDTAQALRQQGMSPGRTRSTAKAMVQLEKSLVKSFDPANYIHVRHILVRVTPGDEATAAERDAAAKAKIEKIKADIEEGMKFEDAAKANSDDFQTKANGGDLSFRPKTAFDPEFSTAAFTLTTAGEISEPIRTAQGWHIIQLVAFGNTASQEEIDTLKQQHIQGGMNTYVQNLMENAQVESTYTTYQKPSQRQPQGGPR